MQSEVQPHYVSDVQPFIPLTPYKLGGPCSLSQDTTFTWSTSGTVLEVFDAHKGERQNYWNFRSDPVVVTEFSRSDGQHLLVGLSTTNVLCLYDVKYSKVIKAIRLPYDITSLEVVASQGGACLETRFSAQLLRYMFGLVAVGTGNGHVLLLDLCLDEDFMSDEFFPGDAIAITKQHQDLAKARELAISRGQHLYLVLNETSYLRGQFTHRIGDSSMHVSPDQTSVTCMKYIPPLSVLAIGFKFGGIQLWNLQKLAIQFSWCPGKTCSPVVKFAFQEPENDPRNYCYLWVVSGQHVSCTTSAELKTVANLYSLACGRKDWIDGFGSIYQDLESCTHRFDCNLTSDIMGHDENIGSRLISCNSVHPAELLSTCKGDELTNDEWLNEDLSLCVLVWESWDRSMASACHMAIFDINQWYQAQMPSSVGGEQCSFFGLFSLEDVVDKLQENDHIMDVCIYPSSLAKFFSLSTSEEFYYPSSLAFRACCLTQRGIMKASYLGIQRQVLWLMEKKGPHCLFEPGELYSLAVHCGLAEPSSSQLRQREELLTLAVENQLLAFLAGCLISLHGQDHTSGVSLKFLLEWAWKKVTHIKMSADKLCETLFNCSGQDLDQRSMSLLHSYFAQLKNLGGIFQLLRTNTGPLTEQGEQDIQIRQEVTHLFTMYLRAILWLHQCSLLPEHAEGDAYGENEVAFPSSTLAETYTNRRREIQKLHNTIAQTDLLLIDAMVSEMGLATQWEKVAGGGLYPPPSLYAALSSYLLHGLPMEDKHCFLLYLLLDLASFLSDKQSHLEEKLMDFPASFDLCPSRVKLTQGFWMLDHKDFQDALTMFLDPMIKPEDILPWQHMRILKGFLYQGEHKKALKYSQVRKPPLQTPEQVKLHLTLLLANRLTAEAFHYQRQCREQMSMDDMLNHFYIGCQQTGNMDALLQLPFSPSEEQALVQFLLNSPEPRSRELLIGYFLQRCRPLEAAHLNTKLRPDIMEDARDRDYTALRSALLSSYLQTLPAAQNKLDAQLRGMRTKILPLKREAVHAVPLSSCVKSVSLRHTSLSSFLSHLKDKVSQTWMPNSSSSPANESWTVENDPLIGTPIFQKSVSLREMDVILATPVAKRPLVQHSEISWTPNKKSRLLDYNPSKWPNSEKRRSGPYAEALSLLQTPPIRRRSMPVGGRLMESVPSILKTKSSLRSTTPPLLDTSDGGKALRFSLSPKQKSASMVTKNPIKMNLSFEMPSSDAVVEDEEITVNYARVLEQQLKEKIQVDMAGIETLKESVTHRKPLGDHPSSLPTDRILVPVSPKFSHIDSLATASENSANFDNDRSISTSEVNPPLPDVEDSSILVHPAVAERSSPLSVQTQDSSASSRASPTNPPLISYVANQVYSLSDRSSPSMSSGESSKSIHSTKKDGVGPDTLVFCTPVYGVDEDSSSAHNSVDVFESSPVGKEADISLLQPQEMEEDNVEEVPVILVRDDPMMGHLTEADPESLHSSPKNISTLQDEVIIEDEPSPLNSGENEIAVWHLVQQSEELTSTDVHEITAYEQDVVDEDLQNPVLETTEEHNSSSMWQSIDDGSETTHVRVRDGSILEHDVAMTEDMPVIVPEIHVESTGSVPMTLVLQCTEDDAPLLLSTKPEDIAESDVLHTPLIQVSTPVDTESKYSNNFSEPIPDSAHIDDEIKDSNSVYISVKEGSSASKTFITAPSTVVIADLDVDESKKEQHITDSGILPDEIRTVISDNRKSPIICQQESGSNIFTSEVGVRVEASPIKISPPRRSTRSLSSRQSSGSSVRMEVEDSPTSAKSVDGSFISATNESLSVSSGIEERLEISPKTDSEIQSGTDSTEMHGAAFPRHSMRLRSGSPEVMEPPVSLLPVTRRRRSRASKTSDTSPSSTESDPRTSVSRISRSTKLNKKSLFSRIITPVTIPEFSEPNYPPTDIPEPATPASALPPFLFSPPLTRSRARRKKPQEIETSTNTSLRTVPEKDVLLRKPTSKNKTPVSRLASDHPTWEDSIILISPIDAVKRTPEASISRNTNRSQRSSKITRFIRPKMRKSAKL